MVESYSGFGGDGEDTCLAEYLRSKGITKVYTCGLAYDYCVGSTAESAAKEGFETYVLMDATRAVAPETAESMKARLQEAGVKEIQSEQI
jgi:nicotinamidase/pyrazinamidase